VNGAYRGLPDSGIPGGAEVVLRTEVDTFRLHARRAADPRCRSDIARERPLVRAPIAEVTLLEEGDSLSIGVGLEVSVLSYQGTSRLPPHFSSAQGAEGLWFLYRIVQVIR